MDTPHAAECDDSVNLQPCLLGHSEQETNRGHRYLKHKSDPRALCSRKLSAECLHKPLDLASSYWRGFLFSPNVASRAMMKLLFCRVPLSLESCDHRYRSREDLTQCRLSLRRNCYTMSWTYSQQDYRFRFPEVAAIQSGCHWNSNYGRFPKLQWGFGQSECVASWLLAFCSPLSSFAVLAVPF